VETVPRRRHRSELAVPATSTHFFEKAARSEADAVFIDLEDAVAPHRKIEARSAAIDAINNVDWGDKTVAIRINALGTEWALRDILEVVGACARLDLVLVPKVAGPQDVQFVDQLLSSLEIERRSPRTIGIEVLIETAIGLLNVDQIAASSPRLEALIFGIGDYSFDMQIFSMVVGEPNPDYAIPAGREKHRNDQWHFALAKIANACRAFGKRPIDGPYTDFHDPAGFRASALRAAALGYEGKWAIHPSQLAIANEVFTPTSEMVSWARSILATIEESIDSGHGATKIKGTLVDLAHKKLAQTILQRAALVGVE
jgi:malyl-CoA/(S)-citramalyl-CoA lyase